MSYDHWHYLSPSVAQIYREFLEDFYSICFSIPEIKTLDTNTNLKKKKTFVFKLLQDCFIQTQCNKKLVNLVNRNSCFFFNEWIMLGILENNRKLLKVKQQKPQICNTEDHKRLSEEKKNANTCDQSQLSI